MSSEIMKAFDFIDQPYLIHKLDPRTKMFLVLIYTILFLLFTEIVIQLLLLASLIPIIINGKLAKNILTSLKNMLIMFIFIIILNSIFTSFSFGIQMSLRFMNILIVFSIFFQTTNPDDLTQALTKIGVPYYIAFSLTLAFRFVPTLAVEMETITDAQKSRGYDIEKGGILKQIKNLFPLLIPIISNSIQRAYYVAESLESRSFGAKGIKRTYLYPLKMKKNDYFLLFFVIIIFVFGLLVKFSMINVPNFFYWTIPF